MKKYLLITFLAVIPSFALAQTLVVKDANTKEPIPVVTISSSNPTIFATTDEKGRVDISQFKDSDAIEIRILGYETIIKSYSELESASFELLLEPASFSMNDMVISATRWSQSSENIPSKISTVSPEAVKLQNPQTAADLLNLSGKVFIQKSQQGGGSPMIRGFATNRLLYTIDGVRMNTAIFRGGNIQNVISLDPFAIESTEVLFGPGSVVYGSDAIGGVMSFQTLTPKLSADDDILIKGKANIRYSSANNEQTGHFDLNIGGNKWAFVSSLSSYDYGHLRQGSHGPDDYIKPYYVEQQLNSDEVIIQDDPLFQIPTAYSQINAMQKVRFEPNLKWDLNYALHYSETSPYGRYDRHNRTQNGLPRYAEWKYGPQKWMMNQLKAEHVGNLGLFDNMNISLAHQFFEESRISRDFNSSEKEIRIEEVNAYSANIDFLKFTGENNTLYYGFEYVLNDVQSTGINRDISTGNEQTGPSRYPDALWQSLAAYINDEYEISDKFTLQAGLRYNQVIIAADFDTDFYSFPFREANINKGSLTGSLGGVYRPSKSWVINANLSTAFRAPNVDDIGKIFDSEPGSVVVPNPDLSPEYAYNADLGIAHTFGDFLKMDVTGYYTILENAIVRRNFTLNGSDSLMYSGVMSRVQALQNVATANVYGIQAGVEINLRSDLRLTSDINFQKGEEESEDGNVSPSRHAAPWFGVTRLTYEKDALTLELNSYYQGEKTHDNLSVSEQGKTDIYALDENGNTYAPSWYTLNFKALYTFRESYTVTAGLENITDQRYRPYSSGVSAPGRNFILSLQVSI
ncbi:MAG: TonB-dependent receptor [Gracilimonas sp.]|uniref:TonB-dependent receptor n=1 Tax=Gracilimonas sp. TaxID=1974203 RepID=UPI00199212AD|nr:TonB-dependent receptor [Gracilimonas sp.]MBD3615931.1 TonB-dependent receptor [Gracilimonas sp.]